MVGEKYLQPEHYDNGRSFGDDQSAWTGDDLDLNRVTDAPPLPDRNGFQALEIFGSAHPGGLHMAMCDASVRAIAYDIDTDAHWRFGHRDDGEVIGRE
jgi:hypothetical protein